MLLLFHVQLHIINLSTYRYHYSSNGTTQCSRPLWLACTSCFHLCRYCCAGGSHVCCGRPRWLELPQHRGTLGPTGQTVELCGQHVDTTEHHGSHSAQWKVRWTVFLKSTQSSNIFFDNVCSLELECKQHCLRATLLMSKHEVEVTGHNRHWGDRQVQAIYTKKGMPLLVNCLPTC